MSFIRTAYKRNVIQIFTQRLFSNSSKNCFKEDVRKDNLNVENEPIKYTTTPANKWLAKYSRVGTLGERLWYEPYVILASLSIFLIYYCVLREENDIDMQLNTSLYQRIPGLEEQQLHTLLQYNREHGLETKDIITRLEELEAQKNT